VLAAEARTEVTVLLACAVSSGATCVAPLGAGRPAGAKPCRVGDRWRPRFPHVAGSPSVAMFLGQCTLG
jgi:hypothetical protein